MSLFTLFAKKDELLTTRITLKKEGREWSLRLLLDKTKTSDSTIIEIIAACSVSENCFNQAITELKRGLGEERVASVVSSLKQARTENTSNLDSNLDEHLPVVSIIEVINKTNKNA